MKKPLFVRLFGAGKMPASISDALMGDRVIFRAEGLRVNLRRSGRVPGVAVARGIDIGWGAFAVTDRAVVGTRGKAKVVDVPYAMASPDGPATLTLDRDGLTVVFDLDRVHPRFHGTMRMEFVTELDEATLASCPHRTLSFPVDARNVMRTFGSRMKLPDAGGA